MGKYRTQEQFLEDARKVHGDRYDYTPSFFVHTKEKLFVRCKTHGNFPITPKNHLAGRGCKECGIEAVAAQKRVSFEDFYKRLPDNHLSRYRILPESYTKFAENVTAVCPKHKEFHNLPSNLIKGAGCPLCAIEATRMTKEEFVEKATKTHGDKYSYHLSIVENAKDKTEIFCNTHQESFWQRPANHIQGDGCSKCSLTGYDDSKPGSLYILSDKSHTKVGITNRDVIVRVNQINKTGKDFVQLTSFSSDKGGKIRKLESIVLAWLRNSYSNPTDKFDGYTETFVDVNINNLLNYVQGEFDAIS